jgi:hypothetical protein
VPLAAARLACLQSEALLSAEQLAEKKEGAGNPFDGFTYVEGASPLGGAAAAAAAADDGLDDGLDDF